MSATQQKILSRKTPAEYALASKIKNCKTKTVTPEKTFHRGKKNLRRTHWLQKEGTKKKKKRSLLHKIDFAAEEKSACGVRTGLKKNKW